jgi:hypothetical protein
MMRLPRKFEYRRFGHWARSETTCYLEVAAIVLAELVALELMGRYF